MNNPHDKFFKESLSNLETAKGFMKNYLPQDLLKLLDLDNIMIEKDSFIEKELEEFFSDILYKVNLQGQEAYLYFLFEHKSYPYQKITLQLLKYMVKIWELKLKQKEDQKLPLIIPMVIYHGQRKWNIGLKLSDMIEDIPDGLEIYLPDYKYLLYDLSHYSHQDIRGEGELRVFLEILSSFFRDDFEERFKEALLVLEKLRKQEKGIEYFETVIRYIINAKEGIGVNDLKEMVKNISTERGEEVMTIADQLREEVEVEIAEKLIKKGMEVKEIEDVTKLSKEKIREIKKRSRH